jgi:hypothetical protein
VIIRNVNLGQQPWVYVYLWKLASWLPKDNLSHLKGTDLEAEEGFKVRACL